MVHSPKENVQSKYQIKFLHSMYSNVVKNYFFQISLHEQVNQMNPNHLFSI